MRNEKWERMQFTIKSEKQNGSVRQFPSVDFLSFIHNNDWGFLISHFSLGSRMFRKLDKQPHFYLIYKKQNNLSSSE